MRNKVKALREELGLTQRELATHVNCSRAYIIGIESGKNPNITTAFRLAKVFKKPVDQVFIPDWERTTKPSTQEHESIPA